MLTIRQELLNAPPSSDPRRQLDENHDPKPAGTMDEQAASSPIIIPQDVIDRKIPIYGLRDFDTYSRYVAVQYNFYRTLSNGSN